LSEDIRQELRLLQINQASAPEQLKNGLLLKTVKSIRQSALQLLPQHTARARIVFLLSEIKDLLEPEDESLDQDLHTDLLGHLRSFVAEHDSQDSEPPMETLEICPYSSLDSLLPNPAPHSEATPRTYRSDSSVERKRSVKLNQKESGGIYQLIDLTRRYRDGNAAALKQIEQHLLCEPEIVFWPI
jgi:hypothetical protein